MTLSVTRDSQTLPITTTVEQGAITVTGSSTPLDSAQMPLVVLLDENDITRKVSPAGDDTLQAVAASLASSATAALNSVAATGTSTTLFAANDARRGVSIVNDAVSAVLYVAYADVASAAAYTLKLVAGARWEMPGASIYSGIITGLWSTAEVDAFAALTEIPGLLE